MPRKHRGAGEGSIGQRKSDGLWRAAITLRNGKRKYFYAKTQAGVVKKRDEAKANESAGRPAIPERQTVAAYLRGWLDKSAKETLRPRTWVDYERIIRQHINPELGGIGLGDLTPADVQALVNAKRDAGLSASRIHGILAVLSKALRQAERWEIVPRNVARLVESPPVRRRPLQPFSIADARTFLGAVADHPLHALFTLALAAGARQGELLALQWTDVDFDEGTASIRYSLQRINGALTLVDPKTESSRRTVTLPGLAIQALRQHRSRQAEAQLRAGSMWEVSGFIFTNAFGHPLEGSNVTHQFQRLLEQIGLPRVRFHDLRHTFATVMLAAGVHHRTLMELMGHSEIGTTMNIYADVVEPLKLEASERMHVALTS